MRKHGRTLLPLEQEASADEELSLDELRLSGDREPSTLASELDWGEIFASERRISLGVALRKGRGGTNRPKSAPARSRLPSIPELQFPPLPSRDVTVLGASSAAAASGTASGCYACLGCGCDACLDSGPTAWRGSGSTRAALRDAVAAMVDDDASGPEPRSRVQERERPRGKCTRAAPRRRPAPEADGPSDNHRPSDGPSVRANHPPVPAICKGAARRLRGKRSYSVAQVRQASARQARRTTEAAGDWERWPRLVKAAGPGPRLCGGHWPALGPRLGCGRLSQASSLGAARRVCCRPDKAA